MKIQTCLLAALAALSCLAAHAQERPNIVLIIADDYGPQMGAYGDPNAVTPNLDRLAESGARFTRAHVTAASCSPSRGSIFTGLYPHQHGMYGLAQRSWAEMHADVPKLPNALNELGYQTAIIGKTHFQPFELFEWDYVEHNAQKVVFDRDVRWMNAQGVEWIEQNRAKGPLFLVMSYVDPHRGGVPGTYGPDRNIKFPRIEEGLPEDPLPPGRTQPIPFLAVDTPRVRMENSDYYAAVERLDIGVGEFMEALDERLDPANTLVVFIGDHGPDVTRGKISAYYTATHIPLLMRWKGKIEPSQVRHELTSTIDLFPTFLDAANARSTRIDERQTGLSLLDIFSSGEPDWRGYLFTEFLTHVPWHYYPRFAVSDGDFHYIFNLHGGERENPLEPRNYCEAWHAATAPDFPYRDVAEAYARVDMPPRHELFHLRADPYSVNNLAGEPAYADKLRELSNAIAAWREETDDPFLSDAFRKAFADKVARMHEDFLKGNQ